jgi:hypothetical protein
LKLHNNVEQTRHDNEQRWEKLFEELFIPGEDYQRTRHEKIFIAANASSFVPERLDEAVDALARAAYTNDRAAIMRGLKNLIPEFQPPDSPGLGRAEQDVEQPIVQAQAIQPTLKAQPH